MHDDQGELKRADELSDAEWKQINLRRLELVRKKRHGGGLSVVEEQELSGLKKLVSALMAKFRKPMFDKLAELEKKLGIKL